MGEKSRGNFLVGGCLRFDCVNRCIRCNQCVNFSYYWENETPEPPEAA